MKEFDLYISNFMSHDICMKNVINSYIQGVNKVRRHCSITNNFRINVHSILKLHRHTNLFNTKVLALLPLLQLYLNYHIFQVLTNKNPKK